MQQLSSSKFMQRVQKQVTSLIPSASIENFDKNRQAKTKKNKKRAEPQLITTAEQSPTSFVLYN